MAASLSFSYSRSTDVARVVGAGWDQSYVGFGDGLAAWTAVNADGFYLAPGASVDFYGQSVPVVRA